MPRPLPMVVIAHPCRRRANALLLLALGMLGVPGLPGCGETTHEVGQVRAESQREPIPREPVTAGRGGDIVAGSAGGTGTAAGAPPEIVEDAGRLPPPTFDPADVLDCGAMVLPAERKQLDLYLMVDNNITLMLPQPNATPWDALLRGIDSYVEQDEAVGTGVGVDYFGFDCSAGTYATPTVNVGTLPDNAAAIQRSLHSVVPINVSPMRPALEGAIIHAKSRANAYPDSKQAVVLISDGYADLFCGSSTPDVGAVAADGLAGSPSITTYVVALDVPSLDNILTPLTRLDSLDAIARQGGTTRSRRIDLQDSTSVFVEAMLDVQHDAESCEYAVPQLVRDEPGQLSLGVTDAAGLARALAPLSAAADCGEGFYFDDDQEWAVLCPTTCAQVKGEAAGLIWFTDC